MKRICFLSLFFIAIGGLNAQNLSVKGLFPSEQLTEIENAVNLYWVWDSDEDPKTAVDQLNALSKKYPKNWLAPFWSSYIATQITNSTKDVSYLDKAQTSFDTAEKILMDSSKDSIAESYFKGLQCLIYDLRSFNEKDAEKTKELQAKALEELNQGLRLNWQNPVLWVLSATGPFNDFNNNLAQRQASLSLLFDAREKFAEITDRSKADISYMNEHWTSPWIKGLSGGRAN